MLLLTDGSPHALRAARAAAEMARAAEGEVLAVYVIPPVSALVRQTVSKGNADLDDLVGALRQAMQGGHKALAQAANMLAQAGIASSVRLEQGVPAILVCQIAQEEDCAAIVIGSADVDRATVFAPGEAHMQPEGGAARSVVFVN
ncbi:MAG: universal stress protein [Anaerolineae bacterium]|nr:universal stress protein [Anaerolineae bacterium]